MCFSPSPIIDAMAFLVSLSTRFFTPLHSPSTPPSFHSSFSCISGTRVVVVHGGKSLQVAGVTFGSYGSHVSDVATEKYPCRAYLTAAAALGGSREEVDEFCKRLRASFKEFRDKCSKVYPDIIE
mmetsp:Transcript_1541/g.2208  ORF Transcript_1541/g.2208 Transcript_1541/m.2208 type:complete len:125 (-) Transcript_1541:329-703(-)